MKNKKRILTLVNLLVLGMVAGNEIAFEQEDNFDKMTILPTEIESVMTDNDVWDMERVNSEYITYVPLRAKKINYDDKEFYYLYNNEGSLHVGFEDLVDGENYLAEIGVYTGDIYELELGEFDFTEEAELLFEEYAEVDDEMALEMYEELNDTIEGLSEELFIEL